MLAFDYDRHLIANDEPFTRLFVSICAENLQRQVDAQNDKGRF